MEIGEDINAMELEKLSFEKEYIRYTAEGCCDILIRKFNSRKVELVCIYSAGETDIEIIGIKDMMRDINNYNFIKVGSGEIEI